ncbi:unnamed protein product, partial [Ectocarpus sp. 12 AP-2014]
GAFGRWRPQPGRDRVHVRSREATRLQGVVLLLRGGVSNRERPGLGQGGPGWRRRVLGRGARLPRHGRRLAPAGARQARRLAAVRVRHQRRRAFPRGHQGRQRGARVHPGRRLPGGGGGEGWWRRR